MRKPVLIALVIALSLVVVTVSGGLAGPQRGEGSGNTDGSSARKATSQTPYKLVAPLAIVMEVADEMFYELPEQIEAKKLKTVEKHASFLAEIANVAGYANFETVKTAEDRKVWKSHSETLKALLLDLAKRGKEKDAEGATELFKKSEAACDTCHEKFRDV